ncbi:MAG TPA: YkgJ family cysteine cluster protein [Polyangiaceae bacterium]
MKRLALELTAEGKTFRVTGTMPDSPVRPRRVLPLLHRMTDRLVDAAIARTTARGAEISCREGCAACCRQLVPVGATEARALRTLVAEMPEPRRSEVRGRFEAVKERMATAGILERARAMESVAGAEDVALGRTYMEMWMPCPFLEDESCSIYPDRPAICREFIVTSHPDDCADATAYHVRPVPLPARASRGVFALEGPGDDPVVLPLALALDWAESHAGSEPPARPPKRWLGVAKAAIVRSEGSTR